MHPKPKRKNTKSAPLPFCPPSNGMKKNNASANKQRVTYYSRKRPSYSYATLSSITFIVSIFFINSDSNLIYAQESDGCDIPAFSSEKDNYNAYDKVSFKNTIYECKPPPGGAWCSSPDFEPGIGLSWTVAWDEVGAVTGPCATDNEGILNNALTMEEELLGLDLDYDDPRNYLFCASSSTEIDSSCSVEYWCRDGVCTDGSSCFGIQECNIQDLIGLESKGENVEKEAIGQTNGENDEEEEDLPMEEYIESNHFFCALDWNVVSKECARSQHCPTGIDDECELEGAICFGGTECNSAKGDGELFRYLGYPYEDARNNLFCASDWTEADSNCRIDYWCGETMACEDGRSCFGGLDCNIQDLVKAEMGILDGEINEDGTVNKVILDLEDPKRTNFCGMTWGDASFQCGLWCPEGLECPEPQKCFADTSCYYDKDITPTSSPTTYPPTTTPTITYGRAENMSFCGSCYGDAGQCTIERHCPNGDSDCGPGLICYNYIPGCNIVDLTKKQNPTPPPSIPPPSRHPTGHPVTSPPILESRAPTNAPWVMEWAGNSEGGEEASLTAPLMPPSRHPTGHPITLSPINTPTNRPTNWVMGWLDNEEDGKEDLPESNPPLMPPSGHPATLSPVLDIISPTEVDLDDTPPSPTNSPTKHVMEWSDNDGETENSSQEGGAEMTITTYYPTYSPSHRFPDDRANTFFCGVDRDDASTACHKRCRSELSAECPGGEACFGYIVTCASETPRTPSAAADTPQPANNYGVRQSYCAETKADLELSCVYAATCNPGDPVCPVGNYCWGDHMCGVVTILEPIAPPTSTHTTAGVEAKITSEPNSAHEITATMRPTTSNPTPMPTILPTKRATATLDTNKEQGKLDPSIPELYCGSSMQELEASCDSAQSCSNGPCPRGLFCFPFTCESISSNGEDESISSNGENEPISSNGESFYCAASVEELDERCGLATECTGNNNACPNNHYCLPYDCKQSLDRCPLNMIGWQPSSDCRNYYVCSNGVAGDTRMCGPLTKFDRLRGRCILEDLVDGYCYGGPITENEEEGYGEIVQTPGISPTELCPEGYVGWQSNWGYCTEYRQCRSDGTIGPTRKCREGTKFDKVRNSCFDEAFVNEYCYDPVLLETVKTPGISPNDICPEGYVGWQSNYGYCKEYHQCRRDGTIGPTRLCSEGTKFDIATVKCLDEALVNNYCNDPVHEEPVKTPGISHTELCPAGYVGWQSTYGHCKEYYQCRSDGTIGPTKVCGEGARFDKVRNACFDEALVNDYCYGPGLNPVSSSDGDTDNQTDPSDAGSGPGASSGGDADNQTGPSDAANAGSGPGASSVGDTNNQTGPYDAANAGNGPGASNEDTGNQSNEVAESGPGSSEVQPWETPPTPPPTFERPDSTSDGGGTSPLDSNRTEVPMPPWYSADRTIVDMNGGERDAVQFVNSYTWLLSLVSIQWMINS